MKITKRQLKRIIREEFSRILSEDREPLKDILDHLDSADVVHALHPNWATGEGGEHEAENLVLPIDHLDVAEKETSVSFPETLSITERRRLTKRRIVRRLRGLGLL